jgi:hypothetical protein
MYPNQRCTRARVSDYSVLRYMMIEMRNLHVSVLRAGVSQLCLSHVVVAH